ncbi:hypothetical protein MCERE19_01224 [Spirosomataceae bacterium]|jgi:hypothetical protein
MTTVINLRDIDFSFFEKLKMKFGDKEVSITINEGNESRTSQKGIFDELEELQKKYPPFIVAKDINLSDLANEVNL